MHQQTIDGLREFWQRCRLRPSSQENHGGHYFLTPAEVGDILSFYEAACYLANAMELAVSSGVVGVLGTPVRDFQAQRPAIETEAA